MSIRRDTVLRQLNDFAGPHARRRVLGCYNRAIKKLEEDLYG